MSTVDLEELRARVRADRRTVAAPLLAFGLLTIGDVAAMLLAGLASSPGPRHITLLGYWPLATAVALLALWWHSRRITVGKGLGPGDRPIRTVATGYLVALPILAILFIPLLFVGVFAPLVWAAAMLLVIGWWQRSTTLRRIGFGMLAYGVVAAALAAGTMQGWLLLTLNGLAGVTLLVLSFTLDRPRD